MLTQAHGDWLEARGIDIELAVRMGLTSKTMRHDGRQFETIAIPYTSGDRIINHKYRWFDRKDGVLWTQDTGGEQAFWNQDVLFDRSLDKFPIIITEGEWDCVAALQCGYPRAVSVPNGAGTNLEIAEKLKPVLERTRKIVLAVDSDEAGQKLLAELLRRFGAARCYTLKYPTGCKDINDVLVKHGPHAVCKMIDTAPACPIRGVRLLSEYDDVEEVQMFETGFPSLHPHLKFWYGGFTVITGVPSHGKSRFSIELVGGQNLRHKQKVAIASFEAPVKPYVRDILREHFHGMRKALLTEQQRREADQWIEANFVFIEPTDIEPSEEQQGANLKWVLDRGGDAVFRHGIRYLLIDPWNQIEHTRARGENDHDYQLRAIRASKVWARTYGVALIVVAHPNKSVLRPDGKLRKPNLYDISGSAHWYNAADHGLLVWADDQRSRIRTIEIQKSRFYQAGMPGSVQLHLDGRLRAMVAPTPTDSRKREAELDFDA